MTTYLTGASNQAVRDVAREQGIGILLRPGNSYHLHVQDYACWAADNGQYATTSTPPSDSEWWAWLNSVVETVGTEGCLFATAPDVLTVHEIDGKPVVIGDAAATIERSRPWLQKIRELGLPAALVAQDGIENLDNIPWGEFDVLFLGGSTEWKIGEGARRLTAEAVRRGVRVHMGRVNSYKRYRIAAEWACDTVDGTFLAFGPKVNLPRLLGWVEKIRAEFKLTIRFAGATDLLRQHPVCEPVERAA